MATYKLRSFGFGWDRCPLFCSKQWIRNHLPWHRSRLIAKKRDPVVHGGRSLVSLPSLLFLRSPHAHVRTATEKDPSFPSFLDRIEAQFVWFLITLFRLSCWILILSRSWWVLGRAMGSRIWSVLWRDQASSAIMIDPAAQGRVFSSFSRVGSLNSLLVSWVKDRHPFRVSGRSWRLRWWDGEN